MLAKIKLWFAKNNWVTHSLAAAFTFLTTAYVTAPTFHTYVNTTAMEMYHALPPWLAQFVVGAIIPLYLLYRTRLSVQGKMMAGAEAKKTLTADKPATKKSGTYPSFLAAALATGALLALSGIVGCTSASIERAASFVSGTLPSVLNAEEAVASLLAALDPAVGVPLEAFQPVITAGITELESLLAQYTASPSDSTRKAVIASTDKLVSAGDAQLLAASRITNADSKNKATSIIASFDALLHVVDGFVQQTRPASAVKATMVARKVKLTSTTTLSNFYSEPEKDAVAKAYGFTGAAQAFDFARAKGY